MLLFSRVTFVLQLNILDEIGALRLVYIVRKEKSLSEDQRIFAFVFAFGECKCTLTQTVESYLDDELRGFAERRDGRVHEARRRVRCVSHQKRLPLHTAVNYKVTTPP